MSQQHLTAHRPQDAIQRAMNIWMQERDRIVDKDIVVIILTHADATATNDPVGWLWKTLARGELRHRRNGGRR